MSTKRGGLSIIFILAVVLTAACGSGANQETWLHGTWELAYNPDNDSEDELTFKPDGTVAIRTTNARDISGQYKVNDQDLTLTLAPDGDNIDVHFEISPDHTRLTYKTGAYYAKK